MAAERQAGDRKRIGHLKAMPKMVAMDELSAADGMVNIAMAAAQWRHQ